LGAGVLGHLHGGIVVARGAGDIDHVAVDDGAGEADLVFEGRARGDPADHQIHGRAACTRCSNPAISALCLSVPAMSSSPSSSTCLRAGSMSNRMVPPSGPRIVWLSRSTVIVALEPRCASSISRSSCSGLTTMGRMPFLKQLL